MVKNKTIKQVVYESSIEVSDGFYSSPDKFLNAICNGCGPKKFRFKWALNKIMWLDVSPACYVHDYDYEIGLTFQDKDNADKRFRRNLRLIIDKHTRYRWLKELRYKIADMYYDAVRKIGYESFRDKVKGKDI